MSGSNGKYRRQNPFSPPRNVGQLKQYASVIATIVAIYVALIRLHRILLQSTVQNRTSSLTHWNDVEHGLMSRLLGMPSSSSRPQCPFSMEDVPLPPVSLRRGRIHSLSNEEYRIEAIEMVHHIRLLLGLSTRARIPRETIVSAANPVISLEDAVIMDYGCGSGRFLIGLLSADVCFRKYIGVDVNVHEIQWLRQTYKSSTGANETIFSRAGASRKKQMQDAAAAERLQFIRVDVLNERYNKKGQPLDTDASEAEKTMIFAPQINQELTGTVDIMVLRSVFSQMLAADMYHHLRALYPILKSNSGIMILTLFLNTVPSSPVETVVSSKDENKLGKILISKEVFEKILYETGYRIRLYLAQWSSGEDIYVVSTDGMDPNESSLIQHDE